LSSWYLLVTVTSDVKPKSPKTRIAQLALRLDRVGEIEEAAGVLRRNENRRTGRA
jgi:hypothetical protein